MVTGKRQAALGLLLALALPIGAQEDGSSLARVERGDYSVMASVVRADEIEADIARLHGLPDDAGHAILNVTVLENSTPVRAEITGIVRNLIGQTRELDLLLTRVDDYVSYLAAVDIAESRRLSFELEVLPAGAGEPLRLDFESEFLPN